jgi:hypothetical protein
VDNNNCNINTGNPVDKTECINNEPVIGDEEMAGSIGSNTGGAGDIMGCIPDFECGEWGECGYSSNSDEVLTDEISMKGRQLRQCKDKDNCAVDYTESKECESKVEIKTDTKKICNNPQIVAYNLETNQPLSSIDLESWKKEKNLDISFLQGKIVLCPSCGNGIKDIGEEGIDCGGACSPCPEKKTGLTGLRAFLVSPNFIKWLIYAWWIILVIILVLIFYYLRKNGKISLKSIRDINIGKMFKRDTRKKIDRAFTQVRDYVRFEGAQSKN